MKKKILIWFPLYLFAKAILAQERVVDPVTSAAILVNADAISNGLSKTNNNLSLINKGQLSIHRPAIKAYLSS